MTSTSDIWREQMTFDDMMIHNIGKLYTFPGTGPVPGKKMDSPTILEDAAITVRDGKISMVGRSQDVWEKANLAEFAECIDCMGKAVIPGFVDPHTHAVFGGSREFEVALKLKGASYLDILEAGGGILRTMKETRSMSVDQLTRELDERLDRMLTFGTTSVEIKSGYGLDPESEIKLLKAIKASRSPLTKVSTFLGPHAIPPEFRERPDAFIKTMIDLLPEIVEKGLAEYADIFCERGVFDAKQSRRFLEAAREAGLKVKIHSDEIANLNGTLIGAELEAASADHLLVSEDKDLDAMKKSGTIPILLPGTLLTIFEERIPRVRDMISMDLPVSIATDLNPNCMVENLQFIQALACYRLRMTPNEILAASTVNAAHSVGLSGRKGRIEAGYDADLLILKDESFDHVVYHFGVNHVDKVILGGLVARRDMGW
jgi:imidazolonepropionase